MFYVLFVLVGFGTIVHSMVDYTLALAVYKVLRKTSLKGKTMTKDLKQALLKLLKRGAKALNGQTLAEHFHVTRQVIVQDIAILRADGALSYPPISGYIYKENDASPTSTNSLK